MYYILIRVLIEYLDFNETRKLENWGKKIKNIEHNPILNKSIFEPINSLTCLNGILLINYFKNTKFNTLHNEIYIQMFMSCFAFHSGLTDYWGYIDNLSVNYITINLFLKDFYLIKRKHNDDIIKYYLVFILLLIRYNIFLERKKNGKFTLNNTFFKRITYNHKISELFLTFKVINELKKNVDSENFMTLSLLFCFSLLIFKIKKYENNLTKKKFIEKILDYPGFFGILYTFYLNNKEFNLKTKKVKYLFYSMILLSLGFLCYDETKYKLFIKKKIIHKSSIIQIHSLWHIFIFLGTFFLEKVVKIQY